jgi:cell division protein FtsZ
MIELDLNIDERPIGTQIKVIGVGGAGGNAINTMLEMNLSGVELIAANTDILNLKNSKASIRIQLGKETTRGLGAGADPEIGKKAAEESREEIKRYLKDTDLLFIVAGMGKGTGTGASPIIADLAKEMHILTIGIVTKPFLHESKKRMLVAEGGISKLKDLVDTLIVIPNEKLSEVYTNQPVFDAYNQANQILYEAAKAISDIINYSGYMNVDFADVKKIMSIKGHGHFGFGVGEGEQRALQAVEKAIDNPLLSDYSLDRSKGVLLNIIANKDFKMDELKVINEKITNLISEEGEVITGLIFDESLQGELKITIIATGLDSDEQTDKIPPPVMKEQNDFKKDIHDVQHKTDEKYRHDNMIKPHRKINQKEKEKNEQMEIPSFLKQFSN